jgi:hypothetical protein
LVATAGRDRRSPARVGLAAALADVCEGEARSLGPTQSRAREQLEDRAVTHADRCAQIGLGEQRRQLTVREGAGALVLDVSAAHLRDQRVGPDRGRQAPHGADALSDRTRREPLRLQVITPGSDRRHRERRKRGLAIARLQERGERAVGGRVGAAGVRRRGGRGDRQRLLRERVDEFQALPHAPRRQRAQRDVAHAQRCSCSAAGAARSTSS